MAQIDHLHSILNAAIAEEIRHVRKMLETLSELLASDEHVAVTYLDQLQLFDLLIQCIDENAAVLDRLSQGACSHEAIAPVRLTMVQERLRAALDAAARRAA